MTGNSFFLTRSSANIIEDLAHRLTLLDHLDVIVGEPGAGKSRLLQEFVRGHVTHLNVIWLRFDEDGKCHRDMPDRTQHGAEFDFRLRQFELLDSDSLIIIDAIDNAPLANMQTLIGAMRQFAVARRMKFLVAGASDSLRLITEAAVSASVQLSRVTLGRLSTDESLQFLSLQTGHPGDSKFRMPRALRREWKTAEGNFAAMEQFAQRHRAALSNSAVGASTTGGPIIAIAALVMAVALIALLLLPQSIESRNDAFASDVSRLALKTVASELSVKKSQSNDIGQPYSLLHKKIVANIGVGSSSPVGETVRLSTADSTADPTGTAVAADTATGVVNTASSIEEMREPVTVPGAQRSIKVNLKRDTADLLQQRLDATQAWLDREQAQVATIQIMTVFSGSSSEVALSRYLRRLRNEGVDLNRIYVYRANRQRSVIHGVMYGAFDSRQQAARQIKKLPSILRENQPMTRTVAGLRKEIRS